MGSGASRCDQRGGTKCESMGLNLHQHKARIDEYKKHSQSAKCIEKSCNLIFLQSSGGGAGVAEMRRLAQPLYASTPMSGAKSSHARHSLRSNAAHQRDTPTAAPLSLNASGGTFFDKKVDPLSLASSVARCSNRVSEERALPTEDNHYMRRNSYSDISDSKSSLNSGSRIIYCAMGSILGPDDDRSEAKYIKKRLIGKGAFGEAYIVERNARYNTTRHTDISAQFQVTTSTRPTVVGNRYVAKVIDLNNMPSQHRQYAQTEIICLAQIHHFAIVGYYEHYILDSEEDTIIIITEFADHGDLHHNLTRSISACYPVPSQDTDSNQDAHGFRRLQLTEREAGIYFIQLLLALHYIHSHRMIHRDVKSANLFLTSRGLMKLGDFGFSQRYESTVSSESVAGTFLGTPYYLSPEMWSGTRYGKKADVWAAGIVLYEMLMDGARPFRAESLPELRRNVESINVVLPEYPPPLYDATSTAQDDTELNVHMKKTSESKGATSIDGNDGDAGGSDNNTAHTQVDAVLTTKAVGCRGRGACAADGSSSGGAPTSLTAERVLSRTRKFSQEMRDFVSSIFQRDPNRRPSTIELLRTPIMQYYLHLFEKHVHSLIEADEAKLAQSPPMDGEASMAQAGVPMHSSSVDAETMGGLHFPCSAEKDLILSDINDVKLAVAHEMKKDLSAGIVQCYEGVVYKQNFDGEWKERYLALKDGSLIISLVCGRQAIRGTERSRKVPLSMINAVSPCDPVGTITRVLQYNSTDPSATLHSGGRMMADKGRRSSASSRPSFAFAISMRSENSIVFGVSSAVELDCWLNTLLVALNME